MSHTAGAPHKQRKFCVLGSRSVGKSCTIIQFVENHFVEAYSPTIENVFTKVVRHRGQMYDCQIVDTAGQDENSIFGQHAMGIDGYVLVYDITDYATFETVKVIHDNILNHVGKEVPRILVGNKCDLVEYRQVPTEVGQKLASQFGIRFHETSARTNIRVAEAFYSLVEAVEKHMNGGMAPTQPGDAKSDNCCIL